MVVVVVKDSIRQNTPLTLEIPTSFSELGNIVDIHYLEPAEADLVCRQCLTEGINFFRKWKKLSEFSDLFGIAILLSVHVSCVASLCVSLYTYGLHW